MLLGWRQTPRWVRLIAQTNNFSGTVWPAHTNYWHYPPIFKHFCSFFTRFWPFSPIFVHFSRSIPWKLELDLSERVVDTFIWAGAFFQQNTVYCFTSPSLALGFPWRKIWPIEKIGSKWREERHSCVNVSYTKNLSILEDLPYFQA